MSSAWCHGEGVASGLTHKRVEFDTFKIRVVELFPDAQQRDGVFQTHPIADCESRVAFRSDLFARQIGERNVVVFVPVAAYRDVEPVDAQCFLHGFLE